MQRIVSLQANRQLRRHALDNADSCPLVGLKDLPAGTHNLICFHYVRVSLCVYINIYRYTYTLYMNDQPILMKRNRLVPDITHDSVGGNTPELPTGSQLLYSPYCYDSFCRVDWVRVGPTTHWVKAFAK